MTLKIKVQVDRLPNVTLGGEAKCQLGIRVSAVIDASAALPTQPDDAALLLPWLWQTGAGAAWSAHDKQNWAIWRCSDGQKAQPMPPEQWELALATRAQFDLAHPFRRRVDEDVADVLAGSGVQGALETPAAGGVISGRTVYGLVESLTALPHPVPAAMQVWTAVTLDIATLAISEDDQFYAVPVFGTTKVAAYAPELVDVAVQQGRELPTGFAYVADPDPTVRSASAVVYPSLSMKQLAASSADPQTLIDLSSLLVRKGSAGFESSDWSSDLALRIAEVLDPSARAMAVLDDVIRRRAGAANQAVSAALRLDLLPGPADAAPPDRLRRVLAALHAQVVAPRARSSRPTSAPAVSFLERQAIRDPSLWPVIAPLLFAQAGAESASAIPAPPAHAVLTRARLAEAAAIVPERQDLLDEKSSDATLDNEQAFRAWLLAHWSAAPVAALADPAGRYLFAGSATRVSMVDRVATVQAEPTGVLDLRQITGDTTLAITLNLTAPDGKLPASMGFKLDIPTALPAGENTFSLSFAPFELHIGGKTHALPGSLSKAELTLRITTSNSGRKVLLGIGYRQEQGGGVFELDVPIDISAVAMKGRLGLDITQDPGAAGAPLRVAISSGSLRLERIAEAGAKGGTTQSLRAALALAYSGPVVAGLMGGWMPVHGAAVTDAHRENGSKDLGERLVAAIGAYVDDAAGFGAALDAAAAPVLAEIDARIAQGPDAAELTALKEMKAVIGDLWDSAKADAKRLALRLVPEAGQRNAECITQDALPLSFAVDQLQDFDDTVDLWARLAGLGVLIGRQPAAGGANEWWSLNVATLHVSQVKNQVREPLGQANAVEVNAGAPSWWTTAQVDPVPLVITEIQGVRNAIIRYECQSIIAEMQKRPQMDPHGQARMVARRPEAYLFPVEDGFPKLPPLTFGRSYSILPYLIAHGGALPPLFRDVPGDPTSWFGARDPKTGAVIIDPKALPALSGSIRSKQYLRTVPIGSPRVAPASTLPGLIEGVASLAAELPVVPPPITVHSGQPARFFLDKEQRTGMLACPPGAVPAQTGVRIEVGAINFQPGATLELIAQQWGGAGAQQLLSVSFALDQIAPGSGIRVDVMGGALQAWELSVSAGACAEDEPDAKSLVPLAKQVIGIEQWTAFGIELRVTGAVVDLIPPSVRWGRSLSKDAPTVLMLDGERAGFPSELVPHSRATTILDGIGAKHERLGPTEASIIVRRPSTPLATYDRWVNGVFGQYGSAPVATVGKALNRAAALVTKAPGENRERMLDDPAVEALVLEVIQTFPTRNTFLLPMLVGPAFNDEPEDLLGASAKFPHGTDMAKVKIAIAGAGAKAAPGGTLLELLPGSVYELRFYGAVAPEQDWFAPTGVSNRSRFATPVTMGWRDVVIGGKLWHLGSPMVQTIEIASDIMPELYDPDSKVPQDLDLPFHISLGRPPLATRDRAVVRLAPDFISTTETDHARRYQALRMVDRIGLIEQRWSWRGRPHPELGAGALDAFGENGDVSTSAREFIDMAFLGRSHNDIGAIVEMRIARAHAYGGLARFPRAPDKRPQKARKQVEPVAIESDLDYRGGANLWRLAIRAKSRYAAMRPNDPALLRFSHTQAKRPVVRWGSLLVPDQARPAFGERKPKRPNLMLVVPLTEAMSADGCVPPLLALFNEPMFPLFHAGDSIEAVVEVARHPYPGGKRIEQKDGQQAAFHASWDSVLAARDALHGASDELEALLKVDADAAPALQEAARQRHGELETQARVALDKHAAFAGASEKAAFTERRGNLQLEQDANDLALTSALAANPQDPVLIAALGLKKEQFAKRAIELDYAVTLAGQSGISVGDVNAAGTPFAKYWAEFSPDPIRTGQGASGAPIAMRCDGPIGYGFDLDTEAGRFDHAGLLVTPVAATVRPWSLVKMRFRRLEVPEFVVGSDGKPLTHPVQLKKSGKSISLGLLSTYPDLLARDPHTHYFATAHEGLAIDLLDAADETFVSKNINVSFDDPDLADAECVTVTTELVPSGYTHLQLKVSAGTRLGMAGTWSVTIARGTPVEVRLVVSRQFTPPDVAPRGDVSVRVRITPKNGDDTIGAAHEHAWLSVLCMPLTATLAAPVVPLPPPAAPVIYLHGAGTEPQVVVRPIRLSEFTPGVWCQFAAAMSRVIVEARVERPDGIRRIQENLPVSDLVARKSADGKTISIHLRQLAESDKVTALAFAADGAPDVNAQLEECLYAVVTRYVYDAFDRLRERPISIHSLPHDLAAKSIELGTPTWTGGQVDTKAPFLEGTGRIRILRVLRGRTKEAHGFESASKEFPGDFFGGDVEWGAKISETPSDAAGQVLGVSQPFDWR